MIGGIPCSGKSTLTREIISGLGSAEDVEPMKLFLLEDPKCHFLTMIIALIYVTVKDFAQFLW